MVKLSSDSNLKVRVGQLETSLAEVNQRLNQHLEKYRTWTETLATMQTASKEQWYQTATDLIDSSSSASALQKLCEAVATAEARLHQLEQEVATMQTVPAKAPSSSWAPSMCDSSLLEARDLVCSVDGVDGQAPHFPQSPQSSSGAVVPHPVLLPPYASPPRAARQPRVAKELFSPTAGNMLTPAMLTPRTDFLGKALFGSAVALSPHPDGNDGPADPGMLGSPRPSLSPPVVRLEARQLSPPMGDTHSLSRTPGSTVASSSASAVLRLNQALTQAASRRGSRSSSVVGVTTPRGTFATIDIDELNRQSGQQSVQRPPTRRTIAC